MCIILLNKDLDAVYTLRLKHNLQKFFFVPKSISTQKLCFRKFVYFLASHLFKKSVRLLKIAILIHLTVDDAEKSSSRKIIFPFMQVYIWYFQISNKSIHSNSTRINENIRHFTSIIRWKRSSYFNFLTLSLPSWKPTIIYLSYKTGKPFVGIIKLANSWLTNKT